jgi:multiple sugar transport system substrate-binding protein
MVDKSERPPSASEAGYRVDRRRFVLGGATLLGGSAILAACGDDDDSGDTGTDTGSTSETDAAETDAAETDAAGTDTGSASGDAVTFGSNYSDEVPKDAIAAAVAVSGLDVSINTVDHNTYQENFNTYIQQPDDVVSWFAGYRMRAFANRGVVGDISDVWADLTGMNEAFKIASTAEDGKQYFVPFYFYAWGLHYMKSLFEEKGYEIPTTWEEFLALLETMQADGLTPLAGANDGRWPQMGMFDMLNLRINGYDFHVALLSGQESWTDDRVKEVFARWAELLPYYQPDANGRTWQESANSMGDKSVGMFLLGNFVTENFEPGTQQDIIDDVDFFLFPEMNPEHGQNAIEAPIDGFMMAAAPENEEGAKALLSSMGAAEAVDAFIGVNPSVVGANDGTDSSSYNPLQQKAADEVGSATYIAQFLDRDTDPDFAATVVGVGIADFIADPSQIDTILETIDAQAATYDFE